MSDNLARVLGALGVAIALVALAISLNAPVALGPQRLTFNDGINVTSSDATPAAVINAAATSVAPLRILSAGTEVARVLPNGFIVGAGVGTATPTATPTPTP